MTYMNHYESLTSKLFYLPDMTLRNANHTKFFLMEEVLVLWLLSSHHFQMMKKRKTDEKGEINYAQVVLGQHLFLETLIHF